MQQLNDALQTRFQLHSAPTMHQQASFQPGPDPLALLQQGLELLLQVAQKQAAADSAAAAAAAAGLLGPFELLPAPPGVAPLPLHQAPPPPPPAADAQTATLMLLLQQQQQQLSAAAFQPHSSYNPAAAGQHQQPQAAAWPCGDTLLGGLLPTSSFQAPLLQQLAAAAGMQTSLGPSSQQQPSHFNASAALGSQSFATPQQQAAWAPPAACNGLFYQGSSTSNSSGGSFSTLLDPVVCFNGTPDSRGSSALSMLQRSLSNSSHPCLSQQGLQHLQHAPRADIGSFGSSAAGSRVSQASSSTCTSRSNSSSSLALNQAVLQGAASPSSASSHSSSSEFAQQQQQQVEVEVQAYCQQDITEDLNEAVTQLLLQLRTLQYAPADGTPAAPPAGAPGAASPSPAAIPWSSSCQSPPLPAHSPASSSQLPLHRRYVCGLREALKAVRSGRAKAVLLAPDIQHIGEDPAASSSAGLLSGNRAGSGSGADCWGSPPGLFPGHAHGSARPIPAAANPHKSAVLLKNQVEELLTTCGSATATGVPVVFALSRKRLGQVFSCRKRMSAIALLDLDGVEQLQGRVLQLAEQGRQAWAAGQQQQSA